MYYEKKRLFVGIDLSPVLKKRLQQEIGNWPSDLIIPTRTENLHVTLCFLGFVQEEEIPKIGEALQEAVSEHEVFEMEFSGITLLENEENPKLLWLAGEPNEPLKVLFEDIERSLGTFIKERKTYRPHVTLAKIKKARWLNADADKKPQMKSLRLTESVDAVTLFESTAVDGERTYIPLMTFPLQ